MGKYDYFDRILWILAEMMDGTENAEFETKITESQWQNMVNDGFGGKKMLNLVKVNFGKLRCVLSKYEEFLSKYDGDIGKVLDLINHAKSMRT